MDATPARADRLRALGRRLHRSAIVQGIGANIAIQLALTFAQLALVPVFVTRWGVGRYGAWLLLFTLPSYIAMADLGFATAAGNDMAAAVARGNRTGAARVYRAVRLVGLATGGLIVLMIAATVLAAAPHLLDGLDRSLDDARAIALLLALYGALGLQASVANAGFRAIGGYALSGYIGAALVLAEAVGAMGLVLGGGEPLTVAEWYLAARLVGTSIYAIVLARRAPWLVGWRHVPIAVLRPLVRPAMAMMAIPAALAASVQGTVAVIGAVLGAAAIPAFTTVRTLSRVGVQAVLIVNHAMMPSMTVADALDDRRRVARYARLSLAASLAVAAPAAVVLLAAGPAIVARWTHGALDPPPALFAIMAATMLLNAIWVPASNLILATNRHETFAWAYLLLSLIGLGLSIPLTAALGTPGTALALLLVDAAMLARIALLWRRLGLYAACG